MGTYNVTGRYTFIEQVNEIEAESAAEAIEIAKKQIGRKENEYENVEFEVEESLF